MTRTARWILVCSFLPSSWLLMQAVHECGHVVGAHLTDGGVERVVLHPLRFSRTDLSANPNPLVVAWSGPIIGVLIPFLMAALTRQRKSWLAILILFFAGFCLLANGLYLGVGALISVGDAGDLLRYGEKRWYLIIFGASSSIVGLLAWHRLGPRLGLVKLETDARVANRAALFSLLLLGFILIAELACSATTD